MSQSINVLPELKEIIGSLLFASKEPVNVAQIRKVLQNTAETEKGATQDFAKATPADIKQAVESLSRDLEKGRHGFIIIEVAKGYRLENQTNCGPWLREFLNKSKANRLSRPALETLAIIAYRQPVTRQEIEAVRGVAVDAIVKNLLELQLIKVIGRSELPGRPWLFGSTQKFLLHFGIRDIADLPNIEELKKMKAKVEAEKPDAEAEGGGDDAEEPVEADSAEEEKEAPADEPHPSEPVDDADVSRRSEAKPDGLDENEDIDDDEEEDDDDEFDDDDED